MFEYRSKLKLPGLDRRGPIVIRGATGLKVKGIALCTHAFVTPKDFTSAHQDLPL